MADAYETGAIYTSQLPAWQRVWYEQELINTIRTKSILVPFARVKEDFNAVNTQQVVFTEVLDAEPNWNPTSESTIWFKGGSLDSRTVNIQVEPYHDIMKFSDYHSILDYIANGQIPGVIRDKLGWSLVATLDILMRNAYMTHPYPTFSGTATDMASLGATDLFTPDRAELARVHMEELDIPGVAATNDGGGQTILCITSPRVIHDIRGDVNWVDAQNYGKTMRLFNSEAGNWGGVRFIKTNRMRLRNMGAVLTQTTLSGATVPGQGSKALVDNAYSPGQAGSTRTVTVADTTGLAVGDYVTIHDQNLGTTLLETDGTQETRRVVEIVGTTGGTLAFDKPLLKDHASGDYVTNGRDVHLSVFLGGPSIVYGIAERPHFYVPPKIDDAMMVNRVGWRGLFKFQMFRPEFFEIHYSAGSTT